MPLTESCTNRLWLKKLRCSELIINPAKTRRLCVLGGKKCQLFGKWCRSGVYTVNFKHISHLVLVFLLSTLNVQLPAGLQIFQMSNFHVKKNKET